jgi:hypothetical protein
MVSLLCNENWEFDENGLMLLRLACINDLPIKEPEPTSLVFRLVTVPMIIHEGRHLKSKSWSRGKLVI